MVYVLQMHFAASEGEDEIFQVTFQALSGVAEFPTSLAVETWGCGAC